MLVIIDTDAMLAIASAKDSLHKKAKALLIELYAHGANLLLLPTTLSEFALVSTHHIGLPQTKAVVEVWAESANHSLLEIDKKLSAEATERYLVQSSKEESLFDCYVMAAAERYHCDCIFSFDKGYKKEKNNFKLLDDVLSVNY